MDQISLCEHTCIHSPPLHYSSISSLVYVGNDFLYEDVQSDHAPKSHNSKGICYWLSTI